MLAVSLSSPNVCRSAIRAIDPLRARQLRDDPCGSSPGNPMTGIFGARLCAQLLGVGSVSVSEPDFASRSGS